MVIRPAAGDPGSGDFGLPERTTDFSGIIGAGVRVERFDFMIRDDRGFTPVFADDPVVDPHSDAVEVILGVRL